MVIYYFLHKVIKKSIIYSFSLFMVGVFAISQPCKSQVLSTEGVDFWVTFLHNHSSSSATSLVISAQRACSGTITNPNTGWSINFSVPAQGLTDVSIPNAQCYCTGNGSVENTGLWITSTDTISLYAANYEAYTFDATNVLPTHALGNEYLVQTYSGTFDGSNIAFLATEDGTTLDIIPSVDAGGRSANVQYSITLNRGQVHQIISASNADLSGTRATSRDCKSFAVFAGCRCTQVPNGYGYCDHIVEQTWPTSSWGKEFIVTNSLNRTRDRVRVTASENNTQVFRDGILMTTLQSGRFYEFEMTSSQPAAYIQTSSPVAMYLYFTGAEYGGNGDPSSVWISPIEQRIAKITFGTFSYGQTLTQYVNIISPTASVPSMRLDGSNIASLFTPVPNNVAYSYARFSITHATHTLEGDSGFVAHVYGLGVDESYSFSVGSSAVNLKNRLYVNGVASVDIAANQEYCMNDTIIFHGYIESAYDDVFWEFGDGHVANGDTVTHVYEGYGYYIVNMIIDRRSTNNNCGGYDTISSFVRILENEMTIYDTICAGFHYIEHELDIISRRDTIITRIFPSFWGCDSIINLHLHVFPIDPISIYASICMGETYSENGFNTTGYQVGLITDTLILTSNAGCDSTIILHLDVRSLPFVHIGNDRILCSPSEFPIILNAGSDMASYEWNTEETTQTIVVRGEGTYSVIVTDGDGCSNTDEVTFELHDVQVIIAQNPQDFCIDNRAMLTAETDAPFILWSTGETTQSIEITRHGSYDVTVTDGYCTAYDSIEIKECASYMYLPNVFTPNGDGTNDYFTPFAYENVHSVNFSVYDRWGRMVYHTENPDLNWDGNNMNSNQKCPDGVYYYVCEIYSTTFPEIVVTTLNGTITIIRSR